MSHHFMPSRLAQAACLALGVFVLPVAHADNPLTLTASETLTYDSNVERNNANKRKDVYSTTGVKAAINKDYGRQNYRASVLAVATRYKNTDLYNNDGYNASVGFSTDIASNLAFSIDASKLRQLQPFEDQGLNRYKEIVTSSSISSYLTYGKYGRWSTNLSLSGSKTTYDLFDAQDKESKRARFGLRYSPTDLLYFDGGVGQTKVDVPKYPLANNIIGDPIKRTDADINVGWTLTGFSNLYARLGWTQEKHSNDALRDFDGITGYASWTFTPAGKVSYKLSFDRDTNNSGGFSRGLGTDAQGGSVVLQEAQNRVATGLTGSANWQATAKFSASANFTLRQYDEKRDLALNSLSTNDREKGLYRSIGFGLAYQPTRLTSLSCDLDIYNRSKSLFSSAYDGQSIACSAAISIQP